MQFRLVVFACALLAGCLWPRTCPAQENKATPKVSAAEEAFLKSWSFGWRSGLLPVPAEMVAELGPSDSQKAQIQAMIERIQSKRDKNLRDPQIKYLDNTDLEGTREAGQVRQRLRQELVTLMASTKEELKQIWTNEQKAVLTRLRPARLEKKATLKWGIGQALSLSPDGQVLAVGLPGGAVKLWNVVNQREQVTLQEAGIEIDSLAFSWDGKTIAGRGIRSDVPVWDTATGRLQIVLRTAKPQTGELDSPQRLQPQFLTFPAEGKLLTAIGVYGTVRRWDIATGEEINAPVQDTGVLTPSAFASDGRTIASVAYVPTGSLRIIICDAATGQENIRFDAYSQTRITSTAVAFSPDGKTLATASVIPFEPGIPRSLLDIKLWDVGTGGLAASFVEPLPWQVESRTFPQAHFVKSVVFSPDGRLLAVVSGHDSGIWDLKTGRLWQTFPDGSLARRGIVNGRLLAFTPDGRTLVVAGTKDLARPEVQTVIDRENGTLSANGPDELAVWDVPAMSEDNVN